MSARVVIFLVLALGLGLGAGLLIAGDEDEKKKEKDGGAEATKVPRIGPEPFKAGLEFSEPPAVRSSNKRLRATLIAQNGTVPVSGIDVAGTQTYSAEWSGGTVEPGFLGPTLMAEPGDTVELTLDNRLKVPEGSTEAPKCAQTADHGVTRGAATGKPGDPQVTNVHFHGLHVTPREHSPYGDTVLVHLPNGKSRYRFKIPETHDRGTFWYHAHVHECTDDEVTRGLAGLLLVGDSREDLPSRFRNVQTRSLALKDVQVDKADGGGWEIAANHPFTKPTHRTVNGLVNPKMKIRPGETQMWRLLNASSGVWYQMVLVDEANESARDDFTVVAQDGNSLLRPQVRDTLLIPPGARFDVLVRGPESGTRVLKTLEFAQGFATFPEDTLATLEVEGPAAEPLGEPERLTPPKQRFPKERGPTRTFTFDLDLRDTQFTIGKNTFNATIDNADFDPKSPVVTPVLGTTERWVIYNKSAEWHPFHIHQDDFRVVKSPKSGQPQLPGDHDIVALPPGTPVNPSVVEIDMPFTDFAGNFVFHCHILDHEDAGMMALVELRDRRHVR